MSTPIPDSTPPDLATPGSGAVAGMWVTSTYAALEALLSIRLTPGADLILGRWYAPAVGLYAIALVAAGALVGALSGFVLGRLRLPCHHVMPTVSALLIAAFLANAWWWDLGIASSPYLVIAGLVAFWLLCGLLLPREDPARRVVGSPWVASLVALLPLWLASTLLDRSGALVANAAAGAILVLALALIPLARWRAAWSRIADAKLQAALTLGVFFASAAMLRSTPLPADEGVVPGSGSGSPNIVLITLDTTRADHLSVYGYPRRTTPRLEDFASSATLYRHAYANGDMTLSSHGSLFTGLYPTEHGAHFDGELRPAISATVPTLGELLRQAGYRNYAVVANSVFLDPRYGFARGFDRYVLFRSRVVVSPRSPYFLRMAVHEILLPWLWTEAMRFFMPADDVAAAAEDVIRAAGAGPFFLFVNFMDPHRPWVPPRDYQERFPDYDRLFDEMAIRPLEPEVIARKRDVTADETARLHAAYDASIAYLDDVLGRLIGQLRRQPWYDSSLIIVTSDHGELFGEKNLIEHGSSVDHGLTSIPLIVKFPEQATPREVVAPVSLVDVFSTIAAAAGVAAPGARRGVDLAARDPDAKRAIILESYASDNFVRIDERMDRMERAIVKDRWKLIVSSRGRRELYDRVDDPDETTDLSATRSAIAEELEGLLERWVAEAEAGRPARTLPIEDDLIEQLRELGYAQ